MCSYRPGCEYPKNRAHCEGWRDANACFIEQLDGLKLSEHWWEMKFLNRVNLNSWGGSRSYRESRSIWTMSGEDGVVFSPARYGLTLHRGDGRLLGLGVLRAGRGLPDWINAEVSESSGCTLHQWEEETTGAGQTKKNTFQIAHSTRNTETDTLKKGNKPGMEGKGGWSAQQRAEFGNGVGEINKEGCTCDWGKAGVKDVQRRDNGSQQQIYRQTHGQRSRETQNFTFEVLILDSSVGTLRRFLKKSKRIYVNNLQNRAIHDQYHIRFTVYQNVLSFFVIYINKYWIQIKSNGLHDTFISHQLKKCFFLQ